MFRPPFAPFNTPPLTLTWKSFSSSGAILDEMSRYRTRSASADGLSCSGDDLR
jgi:hypothetical protein